MNVKMISFVLLLIFTSFTPTFAITISPPEIPNTTPGIAHNPSLQHYVRGLNALSRNRLSTAEQAFRTSANLDEHSPLPLIGLADVALRREKAADAWSWLTQALDRSPNNAHVYRAIGRFHYAQGAYAKAEAALTKAKSLNPQNLQVQLDLGDLYINALNAPAKAIPVYRSVLSINPKHAGAHHALGMALAMTGQVEEAVSELRKAADLAPENPLPHQALGRLYLGQGEVDQALQEYTLALARQKDFIPALLDKGNIYLSRGDFQRAIAEFQQAVASSPKYATAQLKLGMAHQGLKQYTEAQHAYLAAIRSNPNLVLAYNNLAWMAAEQKTNLTKAEQWAKKAVELAPQVPTFLDTLGWVYKAMGKTSEAEAVLTKAASMPPPSSDILYHLGLVYLEQGKTSKAQAAFQQALKLDKDYTPAQKALDTLTKK